MIDTASSSNASPRPRKFTAPFQSWRAHSIAILCAAWAVLQLGGLFSPGLLDDVDSVYIEIAREMLQRHDFVTPTIDGIRFFDKPPLMYWMAAGSMKVFGIHDWAARLPLALGVLALLFAVYALGIRLYRHVSPQSASDRAGLYAALAMATSIGPYLYTRFYIPDILVGLWMTLSVHLFLIALGRVAEHRSTLMPMLGFGAVLALSVLTKGLIGIVFPLGFVAMYLAITRQLRVTTKLQPIASAAIFLIIAAPWHVLAALRNPAIAMPPGFGLPARAGWAWFYLYNEHVARFLGRRIPHDYGQVPVPLFWLLLIAWLIPWAAFLPSALIICIKNLRSRLNQEREARTAALVTIIWSALILGFFTLSSRQEYYHLPALPALALMVGGFLAAADNTASSATKRAPASALRSSLWLLMPLGTVLAAVCAYFALTAHSPKPGMDLNTALSSNPEMYNLSLGHVFDLTSSAMGYFRGPLAIVALGMLLLGPVAYLVRRTARTYAANLVIAAGMTIVLLAAHEGLVRFYPILGSKDLALDINADRRPGDRIMIDGWLTWGSTLLFYTGQPVSLVNGRIYGPWFGSFWPDAPHIFESDASLRREWTEAPRIFLLTFDTKRATDLEHFGPVYVLYSSGGKYVLSNRSDAH